MTETRPCIVKFSELKRSGENDSLTSIKTEKEACFHRFGDQSDSGITNTIAIIELKETGEVLSVNPDQIQFTDK